VENGLGDCGALRGAAVEENGEVYELGRVSGVGVVRRRRTGMTRLLLLTALVCGAILEPGEPAFSGTWRRNQQLIKMRRVEISLAVSCCFVLYCIVMYCMVVRRQSGYMKVEGRPFMQLPEQAAFRHLQP
jgi:hypothetical protein